MPVIDEENKKLTDVSALSENVENTTSDPKGDDLDDDDTYT